jgi:hypothetical protein
MGSRPALLNFLNIIEKLENTNMLIYVVLDFNERLYVILYVQYLMYVSDFIYCV